MTWRERSRSSRRLSIARPSDLSVRLLEYLRVALGAPRLGFSEQLSPISGGYDTRIFAFRLAGAPEAFSGPLALRLLGDHHDPARVLREQTTQNVVVAQGYPAPRALLAATDTAPLGGAFLIMEHLPGRVLPEGRVFGMATLSYYEASSCMRGLVRAGETRLAEAAGASRPAALLDTPAFVGRMSAHFAKLTGVAPTLAESATAGRVAG